MLIVVWLTMTLIIGLTIGRARNEVAPAVTCSPTEWIEGNANSDPSFLETDEDLTWLSFQHEKKMKNRNDVKGRILTRSGTSAQIMQTDLLPLLQSYIIRVL
jgi:hypothetical protein